MNAVLIPHSDWDHRVIIHEGSCDSLTCIGDWLGACRRWLGGTYWDSVAGTVYHIQVTGGYRSSDGGCAQAGPFMLVVAGTDEPLNQTSSELLLIVQRS
jgi:hypothetical protein